MEIISLINKGIRRRMLTVILIILGVAVGAFLSRAFNLNYILTLFTEPVEVTDVAQAQELYNKGVRYVSVSADELFYTDYIVETISKRNGVETHRSVTSSFWVVNEEDKLFFVELPVKYSNASMEPMENVMFKGFLKRETKNVDILTWASESIADAYGVDPKMVRDEAVGNLYITATADENGVFAGAIVSLSILIILLLSLIYPLVLLINPKMHKVYKTMDSHDGNGVVENIIQTELNDLENCCIARTNRDFVLKTYTICTGTTVGIYPTKDLAWAYRKTTKVNGVVSGNFVILKFLGKKAELSMAVGSQNEADEILWLISRATPIIVGYDKRTLKLYNRRKEEFMELWQKAKDDFNRR